VNPRCDVDDEKIRVLAVDKPQNKAPNESLSRMRVTLSLKEALADCKSSIAFTRRTGNLRKTTHSSVTSLLSSSSAESSSTSVSSSTGSSIIHSKAGSTALVFGREESGLTTDEIQLCNLSCSIPTGSLQPSLNLSHAVGVVLSDLFEGKLKWLEEDKASNPFTEGSGGESGGGGSVLKHVASSDDIDKLIDRWSLVTSLVGLETEEITSPLSRRRKKKILGHLRAILSRAQATDKELKALHGLCSAILELDLDDN
jgi:tRNA C32,U32 (ribose-2'-O)-methylase TrmJ